MLSESVVRKENKEKRETDWTKCRKRGEGPGNGLSEGLGESLGEGRNGLMKKRGNQIPSPEYTVSGDYSRPLRGAHPTGLSSRPTVIPS